MVKFRIGNTTEKENCFLAIFTQGYGGDKFFGILGIREDLFAIVHIVTAGNASKMKERALDGNGRESG
jgi:hypothetical protein